MQLPLCTAERKPFRIAAEPVHAVLALSSLMPNAVFYRKAFWRKLRLQRLRQDGYICTVEGCNQPAAIVEHTVTRPDTPHPCEVDRIDLLRSLCRDHDNQIKERRAGQPERRSGGKMTIRGSDAEGMPRDPAHPWNRETRRANPLDRIDPDYWR